MTTLEQIKNTLITKTYEKGAEYFLLENLIKSIEEMDRESFSEDEESIYRDCVEELIVEKFEKPILTMFADMFDMNASQMSVQDWASEDAYMVLQELRETFHD